MMFEIFLSLGGLVSYWHLIMIQTLPTISKRHVVAIVIGRGGHLSLNHSQSLFSSN
jgi:predicted nucleotidyltransferase